MVSGQNSIKLIASLEPEVDSSLTNKANNGILFGRYRVYQKTLTRGTKFIRFAIFDEPVPGLVGLWQVERKGVNLSWWSYNWVGEGAMLISGQKTRIAVSTRNKKRLLWC